MESDERYEAPSDEVGEITWRYNRFGHVEVWEGDEMKGEADEYIQTDYGVESFFDMLGMDVEDIYPGDSDTVVDPGYFYSSGDTTGGSGHGSHDPALGVERGDPIRTWTFGGEEYEMYKLRSHRPGEFGYKYYVYNEDGELVAESWSVADAREQVEASEYDSPGVNWPAMLGMGLLLFPLGLRLYFDWKNMSDV